MPLDSMPSEVEDLRKRIENLESSNLEPTELSLNWKRLLNEFLWGRAWKIFAMIGTGVAGAMWIFLSFIAQQKAEATALSVVKSPEFFKTLREDPEFIKAVGKKISTSFFQDGVFAFELKTCPEGWEPFEKGEGKFILGAGRGAIKRENGERQELKRRDPGEEGGYEQVTLTPENLPRHTHRISTSRSSEIHDGLGGSENSYGINQIFSYANEIKGFGVLDSVLEPTGVQESQLENMPPFVVLTLCKPPKLPNSQ